VIAAIGRKSKVADLVRVIEGATHKIPTRPYVSRRRDDDISERHVCSSLIAFQSALFDELIAQPTETGSRIVATEAWS
jgi:hypothetical protein